jgi:hypothetical protein
MAAWLIAAIERLPPRARYILVAATATLLLASAITTLTLEARRGPIARRSTPTVPARPRGPALRSLPRHARPPVSAADLRVASRVASRVARRFLRSYLQFAYGRASGESVKGVTPGLRSQLMREGGRVAPVEWDRHPRVVSLQVLGTTPGFVVTTATVDDGGVARYRLRFSLQERAGRWLVSNVREG